MHLPERHIEHLLYGLRHTERTLLGGAGAQRQRPSENVLSGLRIFQSAILHAEFVGLGEDILPHRRNASGALQRKNYVVEYDHTFGVKLSIIFGKRSTSAKIPHK